MAYNYEHRVSQKDIHNVVLNSLGAKLTNEEIDKLNKNMERWNFYDGFHWEGIANTDKPQVTENYVRAFVDKFVAYEFGKGFTIKMKPEVEDIDTENDPLEFLNMVWEYNNKQEKCVEIGQTKSITGDAWVQVSYESKKLNGRDNPSFFDPFNEHEKGKIRINVLPTNIVFPTYSNAHDKDQIEKLTVMYPMHVEQDGVIFLKNTKVRQVIYKQVWTNTSVEIYHGDDLVSRFPNKYGVIPFRQIKNYPQQGRNEGQSDIDDIIPLNVELNLKKSDISEVIDYHSAPVTVVFGARIGQLERGANKVWGGLPKDAKVENLQLDGDLSAAQNYVSELKRSMHEVGSIPETALGGDLAISNTSGIALQIALKPLLDRVQVKQVMSKEGLEYINKLILLIAEKEKLISVPSDVSRRDFFFNEVTFESTLPKDSLLELQEIELEMKLGLESREGAMKRQGKDNIQKRIADVDADMEKNPELYGKEDVKKQVELMKEEAKLKPSPSPAGNGGNGNSNSRPVGENKEGKPKQVNAGFQNSPQKRN